MIAMKPLTYGTAVAIEAIEHGMPDKILYRFIGMGNDEKIYKARVHNQTMGAVFKTKIGTMRLSDFQRV